MATDLIPSDPPDIGRRLVEARVSPELVASLPLGISFTRSDGKVVVVAEHRLPEFGLRVVDVSYDRDFDIFKVRLSHRSFEPVPRGGLIPIAGSNVFRKYTFTEIFEAFPIGARIRALRDFAGVCCGSIGAIDQHGEDYVVIEWTGDLPLVLMLSQLVQWCEVVK